MASGFNKYNLLRSQYSQYLKAEGIKLKKGEFNRLINKKIYGKVKDLPYFETLEFRQDFEKGTPKKAILRQVEAEPITIPERTLPLKRTILPRNIANLLGDEDRSYWNIESLLKRLAGKGIPGLSNDKLKLLGQQKVFIDNKQWFPSVNNIRGTAGELFAHDRLLAMIANINRAVKDWQVQTGEKTPTESLAYLVEFEKDTVIFSLELPTELPIKVTPKPPPEVPPEEPPPPELELEKAKKHLTEKVEKMKTAQLDRLIKVKQSQMEEIKMWKEIDEKEEMKAAIKKLKEINKQINTLIK